MSPSGVVVPRQSTETETRAPPLVCYILFLDPSRPLNENIYRVVLRRTPHSAYALLLLMQFTHIACRPTRKRLATARTVRRKTTSLVTVSNSAVGSSPVSQSVSGLHRRRATPTRTSPYLHLSPGNVMAAERARAGESLSWTSSS